MKVQKFLQRLIQNFVIKVSKKGKQQYFQIQHNKLTTEKVRMKLQIPGLK